MKSIFAGLNLKPINKTAATVVSSGFEFKPVKEFENCFKDIPSIKISSRSRAGEVFGRYTVIGLYEKNPKYSHKFVVRCVCGNYSILRGHTINQAQKYAELSRLSMCDECDYLIYIRSGRPKITKTQKSSDSRPM